MFPFHNNPWKKQKTFVFLVFSQGYNMETLAINELKAEKV